MTCANRLIFKIFYLGKDMRLYAARSPSSAALCTEYVPEIISVGTVDLDDGDRS